MFNYLKYLAYKGRLLALPANNRQGRKGLDNDKHTSLRYSNKIFYSKCPKRKKENNLMLSRRLKFKIQLRFQAVSLDLFANNDKE